MNTEMCTASSANGSSASFLFRFRLDRQSAGVAGRGGNRAGSDQFSCGPWGQLLASALSHRTVPASQEGAEHRWGCGLPGSRSRRAVRGLRQTLHGSKCVTSGSFSSGLGRCS